MSAEIMRNGNPKKFLALLHQNLIQNKMNNEPELFQAALTCEESCNITTVHYSLGLNIPSEHFALGTLSYLKMPANAVWNTTLQIWDCIMVCTDKPLHLSYRVRDAMVKAANRII